MNSEPLTKEIQTVPLKDDETPEAQTQQANAPELPAVDPLRFILAGPLYAFNILSQWIQYLAQTMPSGQFQKKPTQKVLTVWRNQNGQIVKIETSYE